MSEANKATPVVITTAENAAVKREILKVMTTVKASGVAMQDLFYGLCERFTGKDSQSGDLMQHFLNQFEDSMSTARNRYIKALRDFSNHCLAITYDDEKKSWLVVTQKDDKGKSKLDAEAFNAAVALVKSGKALPVKDKEPKKTRFNVAKAEKKVTDTLKEFAVNLSEKEHLKPEQLEIKLAAMIKMIMIDLKPAIDAETTN